jgi:hypothetical protein
MGKSRNASSVIFGVEYQIDAAICLFLRDIEKIDKIKVEGIFEDIEEFLEDNSIIYCQVKSVYDPNKTNGSTNKLKKAIESLSECPIKDNDSLLYCSNQIDPLIKDSPLFSGNNVLIYKFNELDTLSQDLIKKYFKQLSSRKYESLSVIKIPYNVSSDVETKKHFIIEEAKKFMIKIKIDTAYSSGLVSIWHDFFGNSATGKGTNFCVTKKEFIWVIIAHLLNQRINKIDIDDESLIEEVERKYESLIRSKINNFEITTKIIGLYKEQQNLSLRSDINSFIKYNLDELSLLIYGVKLIDEIEELALNSIVVSILKIRTNIDRIKKGAKLC